jgi:hypothetical protein
MSVKRVQLMNDTTSYRESYQYGRDTERQIQLLLNRCYKSKHGFA